MTLLEEVVLGVYLGVITGILPGVVSWSLAFLFKYFTEVTVPALGVMVLAVALAGIQGGLLGLLDVEGVTPLVALLVVMMIAMYCHSQGDKMGAEFPKRVTLKSLKGSTLSKDVVDRIGRFGEVELDIVGEIDDVEGYPSLSADTRRAIKDGEWRYPADLSVAELETRLEEDLVREFDLSDVSVEVDDHGKAHVAAAPPLAGLSKRVLEGWRAVSFPCLVPTGLAQGDEVVLHGGFGELDATVLSARSDGEKEDTVKDVEPPETEPVESVEEAEPEEDTVAVSRKPTTSGGEGRLTVAVPRPEAKEILQSTPDHVAVTSRGTRREFELVSLLRGAGKQVRKVDVVDAPEDATLRSLDPRGSHGVIVLAVKRAGDKVIAPRGDEPVEEGDRLFVVGTRENVDGFVEVVR